MVLSPRFGKDLIVDEAHDAPLSVVHVLGGDRVYDVRALVADETASSKRRGHYSPKGCQQATE
ncbi:hypothetical protein AB0M35_00645 [Micromonospora sp. NPDC051196]|uniref:hypothetical protein n=1 Tax=Micromonospora sp. NPDC051196 TaxID=3155281 RepID=UPI00342A352F